MTNCKKPINWQKGRQDSYARTATDGIIFDKEWIEPTENSPYMKDEVYTDGIRVYRCLEDNTLNDATISPTSWTIE